MKNGTQTTENMFRAGQRVKEWREKRGMSRAQLIEKIELLPDNHGKGRSDKQLAYIECGARAMSIEYASLIAQALRIRVEYLLLKDDFPTDEERLSCALDKMEESAKILHAVIRLAANSHGYEIDIVDCAKGDDVLDIDTDPLYYVFKQNGLVMAHLSLADYSELRNEIFDFASYLIKKRFDRQSRLLLRPYAVEPPDKEGSKHG